MFENEGTEIESQSGVTPETSPESQTESQTETAPSGQEAKSAAPAAKEPPFHEHPRWIERQNELNAERQARAELERRVAEMQRRFEESQKPKSTQPDFKEISAKMQERLKGIDPEYQQYMSLLEQQALAAREELAQFREEQFVNRAVSRFDELNKQNSVPKEAEALYKAQLDQAYSQGRIRNLQDLENVYKSIHEPFMKMLESREKAYLEKYTTAKKADATKPAAQPKGKAASPSQGPRTFANDQQRKAAIVADVVTELRASRDIG
jgi:hypothetical protein